MLYPTVSASAGLQSSCRGNGGVANWQIGKFIGSCGVDGFSEGVAFYASGNIASEALGLYSTDLWTEACAAKAVRDDVQRMYAYCLGFRPTV